jgi:Tol biopolymer transport system component
MKTHGLEKLKLPAVPLKRDRESSKCKVFKPSHCSSLANAAARLVDETCRRAQVVSLKSSRYGEGARWSIFISLALIVCLLTALSCTRDKMTVTGAEYEFGKNKVNDTHYDWKEISGNRFRIIYPDTLRQRALDVAQIYDTHLESICQDLALHLDRDVPVFLYPSQNEYETTNVVTGLVRGSGGFTEFFKERVVFPVQSNDKRLERLALHEITHAVQLKYLLKSRYRSLQIILTGVLSPLWFMEGVAQYESKFWDTLPAMYVRDAVMDHDLIPLNQLRGFSHLPPHQIRLAYDQSGLFIQFLVDTYGQESIARLLRLIKNRLNVRTALQEVTGKGIHTLERAWREYANQRLRVGGSGWQDPMPQTQLLTANKGWNFFPTYSPDGSRFAFLSDWENEAFDFSLYILERSTGRLSRVVERFVEVSPPSWSRDGTRLVFVSDKENRSDLYIYDFERNKSERIKQEFRVNSFPSFLPGDAEIGFVANVNGYADIYKINLDDGKLTTLTQTINDEAYPHWSADGKFLIYSREYQKQFDLVLKDLSSGEETRLTNTPHDEIWPVFMPEGKMILYVSDQSSIFNLHLLDLQNGSRHRLSQVIGGIFSPQISPDGKRVLFTYFRHGQYKIFEGSKSSLEPGVENAGRP